MRTFNVSTIRRWQARHAEARESLRSWYQVARSAQWRSLADVRQQYASADQVGSCLVFNIKGNQYRLICGVLYASSDHGGFLYLKHFLTHAEYDKRAWKEDCQHD